MSAAQQGPRRATPHGGARYGRSRAHRRADSSGLPRTTRRHPGPPGDGWVPAHRRAPARRLPGPALRDRGPGREDDRVVVRCLFEGTHDGTFLGMPPTGRRVCTQHIHIYRIQDDMVAEHWACRDDIGASNLRHRRAKLRPTQRDTTAPAPSGSAGASGQQRSFRAAAVKGRREASDDRRERASALRAERAAQRVVGRLAGLALDEHPPPAPGERLGRAVAAHVDARRAPRVPPPRRAAATCSTGASSRESARSRPRRSSGVSSSRRASSAVSASGSEAKRSRAASPRRRTVSL